MAHGTVVQEPSGRLRMYYTGYVGGMPFEDPLANPLCLHCVAYSGDGLHWEKPGLGLYPYQGRTDTNMVLPCRPEVTRYDQMSVIYDARDPDPTRRWKMGGKHSGKGLFVNDPADPRHALIGPGPYEGAGYYAYFSEDGLRWRQHPEPIMTDGWSLRREEWPLRGVAENQSVMFDSVRNKFVAFVRIWDCRTGQPGVWRARADLRPRRLRRCSRAPRRRWSMRRSGPRGAASARGRGRRARLQRERVEGGRGPRSRPPGERTRSGARRFRSD